MGWGWGSSSYGKRRGPSLAERLVYHNAVPQPEHWDTLNGQLHSCTEGTEAYRTIEAAMAIAESARRSQPKRNA
jgi:carbonic anhydrase